MEAAQTSVQKPLIDRIFQFFVSRRVPVIRVFQGWYILLLVVALFVGKSAYYADTQVVLAYTIATWAGKLAIFLYALTAIPGIARRFRFVHKGVALLMIFRRYIGISVYLLVFIHMVSMFLIPFLRGFLQVPPPLFMVFGILAHTCLFFLFLTSNDYSVKRLDHWWHTIHRLTYIILFFIFFHVALQRVSVWSVLMGGLAVAQLASFVASYKRSGKFIT